MEQRSEGEMSYGKEMGKKRVSEFGGAEGRQSGNVSRGRRRDKSKGKINEQRGDRKRLRRKWVQRR